MTWWQIGLMYVGATAIVLVSLWGIAVLLLWPSVHISQKGRR